MIEEDVPVCGEYRREGKIRKWLILLGLVEPPGRIGVKHSVWIDVSFGFVV